MPVSRKIHAYELDHVSLRREAVIGSLEETIPNSTAADEKAALPTIKVVDGAFLPAFSNQ